MTLAEARRHADKALGLARARGLRVAVAVVDEWANLMQADRMDGAPPAAVDVAEAKAVTALNFRCATAALGADAERLRGVVRFPLLAVGGGEPIVGDGCVIGALGISGGTTEQEAQLARDAMAR